ncbi:MAG: hypothetical protein WCP63_08990 [Cyanobium sp. ELA712]
MTALLGTAALLERSRLDVQQKGILRHHELLERHRQERAQQLALQRIRVRAVPGAWCASTGGPAACAGIPTTRTWPPARRCSPWRRRPRSDGLMRWLHLHEHLGRRI